MIRWRRLALSAVAALLAVLPARAQRAGEWSLTVDQFRGENGYIDSARLPPNQAQTAVNVITEHGFVEKRGGSVQDGSAIPATIENFTEYVKTAGTRVILAHAGTNIYVDDLVSVPAVISTASLTAKIDFVNAFNKAIWVDGSAEVEYDGTSTTTVVGFPGCAYVEFYVDRIWCANIAAESQSAVRLSSAGGTGYWVVPANPNAVPNGPNVFYISRDDGQAITCLKRTPWGMVFGKRRSMWVVKGIDNTNFYIRNVDPAIGCVDDRTMQMVEGRLQWLAVDGVYSWDGANPVKIESLDEESTVLSARQSSSQSQSWGLDSQSDFTAGFLTPSGAGAPMSVTVTPGSVAPSSFTLVDNTSTSYSAGVMTLVSTADVVNTMRLSSVTVQDNFSDGDFTAGATTWTISGGGWDIQTINGAKYLHPNNNLSASGQTIYTTMPIYSSGSWSWTWRTNGTCSAGGSCFEVKFIQKNTQNGYGVYLANNGSLTLHKIVANVNTIMATANPGANSADTDYNFKVEVTSANGTIAVYENNTLYISSNNAQVVGPGYLQVGGAGDNSSNYFTNFYYYQYQTSGTYISQGYNTAFSTPILGNFNVNFTSEAVAALTFQMQSSNDGVSWGGTTSVTPGTQPSVPIKKYYRHIDSYVGTCSTKTAVFSGATMIADTSGYYYSPVHAIGSDISSWGNFDVGQTLPGSSAIAFSIRQANSSFAIDNTSISWTNQTVGQFVALTVSTPTWVQWRSLLTPALADQPPTVDLVRLNFNSGLNSASAASAFINHHYFLCLAISSTTNDTCIMQQRTRDWVTFLGQNIAAYTIFNNSDLLGASGTSNGKIWREMVDGVYNDDGTAIDAYWISPDYIFGEPVRQKALNEIWVDAMPSTGTFLSVGYSIDRSTTFTSRIQDLSTNSNAVNKRVPITSGWAIGKYLRLKFENAQDAYFRMNAFTLYGQTQPRID